ncbi:ABSCISIC ACID-INSENSITIVE 5-like protein 5 [Ricinus communis]|uniref:ABSCISIC ACID-INSENSITIVE 5-like protein 5 n=1 Tax=Ricinus communis TaxID=3988 RepID=UPI00201B0484|nr:ABSCISIC ACID-INSENSITIVE 5-like protein 5 [Ricinus communis]XP_015582927.2 ABSCISIC ACID-INSENSITIVE 5-like protein 5 [Ricinus communis]
MFSLHLHQDEEPNYNKGFPLTDLSLSSGVQRAAQQEQTHVPYDSHGNLVKYKRHRSLDGEALTIATGSSSSLPKFSTPSGVYGGGHSSASLSDVGSASLCQQRMSGYGAGLMAGGGSEVTKANQIHHSVMYGRLNGGEIGKKMSCYGNGRSGVTFRHSSASEKIRHRMIKNRESAARSRARKQALEAQQQLENAALKKENDLLKRVVRFLLAIVRTKRMKLPTLARSFSAPF